MGGPGLTGTIDLDLTPPAFTVRGDDAGDHLGYRVASADLNDDGADDLILGEPGCLSEMIAAHRETGGHMVATMEVEREATKSYGILDPISFDGPAIRARGMVEKPDPEEAPSCHAVVGRYVLDSSIFDGLAGQAPGAGGEIQLTDAIAAGIGRVGLAGFRFSGRRFDCGSKAGFLQATVAFGMAREDLRDEFGAYLHDLMAMRKAAQ